MLLVLLWTVSITPIYLANLDVFSHHCVYYGQIVPDNPSELGEEQRILLREKLHLNDTQKTRLLQLVNHLQRIEKRLMVSEWCITNLSTNVSMTCNYDLKI